TPFFQSAPATPTSSRAIRPPLTKGGSGGVPRMSVERERSQPPRTPPSQGGESFRDPSVDGAADGGLALFPAPLVIPPPSGVYPIDLATALRLADLANPRIGAARTMVLEALALQMTARSLLLPSLNSGVSYHGHNGDLQRSSGKIINLSLQSLYLGAG